MLKILKCLLMLLCLIGPWETVNLAATPLIPLAEDTSIVYQWPLPSADSHPFSEEQARTIFSSSGSFYGKWSALSGTDFYLAMLIEDIFPSLPPDSPFITREIASLTYFLTGDETVFFTKKDTSTGYYIVDKSGLNPVSDSAYRASDQSESLLAKQKAFQPNGAVQQAVPEPTLQNVGHAAADPDNPDGMRESVPAASKPDALLTQASALAEAITPPAFDEGPVNSPDLGMVAPFVASWAAAWEQQDVAAYLSHYAEDFKTPGGMSLASWKKQRHQRLGSSRIINIEIRDLHIEKHGASGARATFIQEYQSDTYHDRTRKTLELAWASSAWHIMAEATSPVEKR